VIVKPLDLDRGGQMSEYRTLNKTSKPPKHVQVQCLVTKHLK